jgi:hypothetical protein
MINAMRATVCIFIALTLAACSSDENCLFVHDHSRYEPVLAKVRGLRLEPGERRQYRLGNPADPTTLRVDAESPPPERGEGAGTVWVEKVEQSHLFIAIETKDEGHAGEWGYLYADRGVPMSRGQSHEGPGREWTLDCDLGDGWWAVAYRLD